MSLDPKEDKSGRRQRTVTDEGAVRIAPRHMPPSPASTLNTSTSSGGGSSSRATAMTSSSPILQPSSSPPPRSAPLGGWGYYRGVSDSILIASSATVPEPSILSFGHPPPLHLIPISPRHSLVPVWEPVSEGIMDAIDRIVPPGGRFTLDACRIGVEGKERTVVWIGVPTDVVTEAMAEQIVEEAVSACTRWNVADITIEVKTSLSQHHVALINPADIPSSLAQIADPFCSTMGTGISSSISPFALGTVGLSLTLKGRSSLLLLTAKHVFFTREQIRDPACHRDLTSTEPAATVFFHTPSTLNELYRSMQSLQQRYERAIPPSQANLDQARESKLATDDFEEELKRVSSQSKGLRELHHFLRQHFGPTPPPLSTLLFHAPYILGHREECDSPGRIGFTQDFALVETEMTVANTPWINSIDLRSDEQNRFHDSLPNVSPGLHEGTRCGYLLATNTFLSFSELMDEPIAVIMRGATSGITVGTTNILTSVVRDFVDNKSVRSRELPVFGANNKPFSACGDSGATVLTRKGDLVGVLTAGNPPSERVDITYITPFFFLFKRWRALGLDVSIPTSSYPL